MKSLFPEMEREIAQDRLAQRREERQHARHYLRDKNGFETFILGYLTKHGPSVDYNIALELQEVLGLDPSGLRSSLELIVVAQAMARTGKLWSIPFDGHPSGDRCLLYGIRGVHPK